MRQDTPNNHALDYATLTPVTAHSSLGIASVTVAVLTAIPFYLACTAAIDWHAQPSFYVHPLAFSLTIWPALFGAGLGLVLGMAGLGQNHCKRAAVCWGLALNGLLSTGVVVLMIATHGGTRSP